MKYILSVLVLFLGMPVYSEDEKGSNPFGTTVIPRKYVMDQYAATGSATEVLNATRSWSRFGEGFDPIPEVWTDENFTTNSSYSLGLETTQVIIDSDYTFELDTNTSVLEGVLVMEADVQQNYSLGEAALLGGATFTLEVEFEVVEQPAGIGISGSMRAETVGGGHVVGSIELLGLGEGSDIEIPIESSGDGQTTVPIGILQLLEPGMYRLFAEFRVGDEVHAGLLQPPKGGPLETTNSHAELHLDLFGVGPATSGEVFWEGLDGNFNDASNWEPQMAPDSNITAVFDKDQTYTVNFGSEESARFVVERGNATFSNGSYQALGGTPESPSAIVGRNSVDQSQLSLGGNHHLATNFSAIALNPQTNGRVIVYGGSSWAENVQMTIGDEGTGFLYIRDSAMVTSAVTVIGNQGFSDGRVLVGGPASSKGGAANWTTGNIAIGLGGDGEVEFLAGSIQSDSVFMGSGGLSIGVATVGSEGNQAVWSFDGPLEVGVSGEGELSIVKGGELLSSMEGYVLLGATVAGTGGLHLEDPQSALNVPNRTVILAQDGNAAATVSNGAMVVCGTTEVGRQGIGEATLTITSATWTSSGPFSVGGSFGTENGPGLVFLDNGIIETGDLSVYSNGTLKGAGVILTPNSYFSGSVAPSITISPPLNTSIKKDAATEALTFAGDVDFEGALIEIDVGGLTEGNYGVLHATGAVDILSATIRFSFVNGFLPRMGDTVPFLIADGALTTTNLAMEYEGAADGFMFDVMEENGMLMFKALNDAQPEGVEPTPRPTTPNPNTDINGDKIVDANDLLEVMRNWHRVVPQ